MMPLTPNADVLLRGSKRANRYTLHSAGGGRNSLVLVARLTDAFTAWRARDLAADQIRYLFFDGWFPVVRVGTKRTRVPVLVTLGVTATGERRVLDRRVAGAESAAA